MYGGTNGIASTQRNGTVSRAATYNETSNNTKIQLDAWYQANIAGKPIETYISDNIFCNDRQLRSEVGGLETGEGYGISTTYYAAYYRLYTIKTPNLRCGLKNDRFTVSDITRGNGNLAYPVGLITADEASMAGLISGTSNSTNYLYTGQSYWTSSPSYTLTNTPRVWYADLSGGMYGYSVLSVCGLRVMLNLTSDVIATGEGTATNPFKV